ncbi:hypothetical protein HYV70_00600 [Candidatus Uhrbacteria bacterium]|nr:hypothetical protein [Candidatus Uhrbacteria bacterium]
MNSSITITRATIAIAAATQLGSNDALQLATEAHDLIDTADRFSEAVAQGKLTLAERLGQVLKTCPNPVRRVKDAGIKLAEAERLIAGCQQADEARAQAQARAKQIANLRQQLATTGGLPQNLRKGLQRELNQLLAA